MSNNITIGDNSLAPKEFNGQRVITFKDIDLVHQRPDGTAGRNFRQNKEHFIEGEDFYTIKPSNFQTDEIRLSGWTLRRRRYVWVLWAFLRSSSIIVFCIRFRILSSSS